MAAALNNRTTLEPTITQRRRETRNSVYRLIYDAGHAVSKQEIATTLGLSLPTVHQNISELLDAGLIRAGEMQKSTGGRPPVGYEVDPNIRYSVSVSVSSNHVRFWAGNLLQEELAYQSLDVADMHDTADKQNASIMHGTADKHDTADIYSTTDRYDTVSMHSTTDMHNASDKRNSVDIHVGELSDMPLREELDAFLSAHHLPTEKLLGVGVNIPGVFDEGTDQIVLSPTLQMKNFSVKTLIDSLGVPVKVMNDSSSAGVEVLLERRRARESEDFVALSLENGVGGAIFANGRQLTGRHGRSAEFGHMRIVPDGRMCNCGQKGCLEAYCSAFRLTRDLGLDMETFFANLAAEEDKGPLTDIFRDWLHYLALGIINLRMAFDCDIVLCGFVTENLSPYLEELRQQVSVLDPFGDDASYVKLAGSSKAALKGAAWQFTRQFIEEI